MGYAAALSWVFFVVMLSVTALLFRSARRWVFYMEGEGD
jgi:ABC-type sugar transport system permease subunit